jgi:U3 small nucleolar RNA-associated protein 10
VIGLHLDLCGSHNTEPTMAPLVKAVAKRAPAKTVLLTMTELWPPLHHSVCGCYVRRFRLLHDMRQAKQNVFIGYFDVLKKALHSAPRPIVLEYLRPMFKVFLEALEVVGFEVSSGYSLGPHYRFMTRPGRGCRYLIVPGNGHQIERVLF